MMGWDDGGWGTGAWLVMGLMMVLFWGAVIALVVWLVQSVGSDKKPGQTGASPTDRADEVLAERFARGEIDEDEFRRRRDLLHSGDSRG
jgi:putative membrane protein